MQNMDEQIKILESEAERVLLQAEQERAMVETLPVRFANNIAAFKKYIPSIAEKFEYFKPEKSFRFFCNENGVPNLEWTETNVSIYGGNPYEECESQINTVIESAKPYYFVPAGEEKNYFNQIHIDYMNKLASLYYSSVENIPINYGLDKNIPLCLMFGVGLGYQLSYLFEKSTPKNLFVFEPDSDLFYASLYCFDWWSLLGYLNNNSLGLHIFVGQNEDQIMMDMRAALSFRGEFIAANFYAFWHYPSDAIFNLINKVSRNLYLLTMGWGFFDDNLFAVSHSMENMINKVNFFKKTDNHDLLSNDIPVFVIGNGPSLDAAIPYIKKYRNKAFLISCGSGISALHKAGIKPDVCVAIERTKAVADFFGLLNDDDYLKDILFISSDVVHPDCMNYFSHSILTFKQDEAMYMLCAQNFSEMEKFKAMTHINPLVGNIGLALSVYLGFDNIYMFGLDNGYKTKEHHHSKHSAYYDKEGNAIRNLTELVSSHNEFVVPGNYGCDIISNAFFATSANVMSELLKEYEGECFNCSDGAFVKGAMPLHLHELKFDNDDVNSAEIIKTLLNERSEPLGICIDEIKNCFGVPMFFEVVDNIIEHLNVQVNTRDGFLDIMQQIQEYIIQLIDAGYAHIYRFLSGTITYTFSMLVLFLYRFKSDKITFTLVEKSILIITEYLEETKFLYQKAFDMKDITDSEIVSYYRKG